MKRWMQPELSELGVEGTKQGTTGMYCDHVKDGEFPVDPPHSVEECGKQEHLVSNNTIPVHYQNA